MENPHDLMYSKTDEWVKVQGKIGTIGITFYAQDQLSDVVFVDILLKVGDIAKKGTNCVTIESVKAAADVNLPVSGKVIEINEKLPDTPEIVNTNPYNNAWMIKLELSVPSELTDLLDVSAYEAYCAERSH
jgi:glycine cleavage system H protein